MSEDDLQQAVKFLEYYQMFINNQFSKIDNVIENKVLQNILEEYHEHQIRKFEPGFSLFSLISDIYYRENFHSDIIHALLNPLEKHSEGPKFLNEFLLYIKSLGANINLSFYSHAELANRELGKIDILILDNSSKRAIIIENKIYGAPDMPKQLPRYFQYATEMGYTIDAII
jgi:hypothetical protein